MTLIPILQLFTALGHHRHASWRSGWPTPATACRFAIYLLRNFFGGAAARDVRVGRRSTAPAPLTIFFRLVLPTSVPALASLAIFQFLWVWNDLLIALVYPGRHAAGGADAGHHANLVNSLGQDWQLLTAAAFISMALPLVVFFALQRYFVRGHPRGSVKG